MFTGTQPISLRLVRNAGQCLRNDFEVCAYLLFIGVRLNSLAEHTVLL